MRQKVVVLPTENRVVLRMNGSYGTDHVNGCDRFLGTGKAQTAAKPVT